MRYQFLLACLLTGSAVIAQQSQQVYVPPSPEAAAMVRSVNLEVGHYTGIANVGIPIGTLPGKDISIPVTLGYNASGIKVQDVASSAGLGWNLQAGGAITRLVQGLPDEKEYRCSTTSDLRFFYQTSEVCDAVSDIYYFSLLGRNGKFFVDGSGNPQMMPYQDLKIQKVMVAAVHAGWKITDEAGYVFHFGIANSSTEESTYRTLVNSVGAVKPAFTSSWYLAKIMSPSGIEIATFTYSPGSAVSYRMYSELSIDGNISMHQTEISITQPKYITAITTALGKVTFGYLPSRTDLTNGWTLSDIKFHDINNVVKQKFVLETDYFMCNPSVSYPNPASTPIPCRLRLKGIRQGLTNQITKLYDFVYTERYAPGGALANPVRNSNFQDYAGYFNLTVNEWGMSAVDFQCNSQDGTEKWPTSYADVFSLKEILNSAGGKTVFEYSSQGGLRIESISSFDGNTLKAQSVFTYAGYSSAGNPFPMSYTTHDDKLVCNSTSFRDIYDLNGVRAGYSTVTETFLDGSKTIYDFTNFSDHPDAEPLVIKYKYEAPDLENRGPVADQNGPPFGPGTSKAWMRGLPTQVRIYDSENNLLRREVMNYAEGPVLASILNTSLHTYKQSSYHKYTFLASTYSFESRVVTLTDKTTFTYGQNGYSSVQALEDKSTYTYHAVHKTFPSTIVRQVGSGPQEKISYRYPGDLIGSTSAPSSPDTRSAGIWALYNGNVITSVETVTSLKDIGESTFRITGASLTTFRKNTISASPLPYESYSLALTDPIASLNPETSLTSGGSVLSFDNRYVKQNEVTHSDSNATLTSMLDSDGITTTYEYLNNSLLSAVIVNPGANQMRKDYAFNTILGLTESTDVNGRKSKFEYESNLGRLRLTRDHDNNIVTRYRYHNITQTETIPEPTISIGTGCINQPISFAVADLGLEYGQTTYHWKFGDGATQSTTSSTTTHSYTVHGPYSVELSLKNPEYFSTQKSVTAIVSRPVTGLTIIVEGPSSIDICAPQTLEPTTLYAAASWADGPSVIWEYQFNGGSWIYLNNTMETNAPPGYGPFGGGTVGEYNIRCTLTDKCGNTLIRYVTLTMYQSIPNCGQW